MPFQAGQLTTVGNVPQLDVLRTGNAKESTVGRECNSARAAVSNLGVELGEFVPVSASKTLTSRPTVATNNPPGEKATEPPLVSDFRKADFPLSRCHTFSPLAAIEARSLPSGETATELPPERDRSVPC